MSKEGGGFFNYLIIVIYAACIVALAGAELHRRYHRGRLYSDRSVGASGQLVRDLHGDVRGPKADLSNASPVRQESARKSRQEQAAPAASPEERSGKTAVRTGEQSDELGWSDRRELNKLIDDLAP